LARLSSRQVLHEKQGDPLERALAPVEPSAVRAALFTLLAGGKLVAPELDRVDLSARTLFRRTRA
jgi:hypothetical protein